MRVATLGYPSFRRNMALAIRGGRKAAREENLVRAVTELRILRDSGYLTKRHVRSIMKPWSFSHYARKLERVTH